MKFNIYFVSQQTLQLFRHYLCRFLLHISSWSLANRDLHVFPRFLFSLHFIFSFIWRVIRVFIYTFSQNLSGAKNISRIRAAAAGIDCSPEPQVAKWAGVAAAAAAAAQQHSPDICHAPSPYAYSSHTATFGSVSSRRKLCEILATHCFIDTQASVCAGKWSGTQVECVCGICGWQAVHTATSCSANCLRAQANQHREHLLWALLSSALKWANTLQTYGW